MAYSGLTPLFFWLNDHLAQVGGMVFISVAECSIDGPAQVLAIGPSSAISKVAITLRGMSPELSHGDANATDESFDASEKVAITL